MEQKNIEFVNVGVRIRPSLSSEHTPNNCINIVNHSPAILYINERNQMYSFDHIFTENATQKVVYEKMVEPLVKQVKLGYNCTIFAYGQTGTGKTYTMGSNPNLYDSEDAGFLSRTLNDFFIEDKKFINISVSFYEVYNEKVFDLLNDQMVALPVKGFKIDGLQEKVINNKTEASELLKSGSKNRHIGETKQNSKSSRSHAIFTIYCHIKHEDHETKAKLNLVDLAGSESVRKTESKGSQFHEGININKGLFNVGQVISALSANSHVPYRQSVITSILQDSLSKYNYVTLIACISPEMKDIHETVCTLDFAQKAKRIKNKPEINSFIRLNEKINPVLFNKSSAIKSRRTPMKRINSMCSYQTPMFKTPRIEPINEINKDAVNSTALESPRSLFSMSLSSISDVPQNFSPVIKKYFDAFEVTVMEKIQTLLNDTKDDKNASFDWNKLQKTVARVVKNEINQVKTTLICNSPQEIGDCNESFPAPVTVLKENVSPHMDKQVVPKKLFAVDDNVFEKEHNISGIGPFSPEADEVFKLPKLPVQIPKKPKISPKKVRRSMRILSIRNTVIENDTLTKEKSRISAITKNTPRPTPAPRKTIKPKVPKAAPRKNPSSSKCPKTSRAGDVLAILNCGNEKDLQTLATIGIKTANQIILYRKIHGQFNSLAELENMPWHGNILNRFMKANFLA